jgi:hypothetical protein
MATTEELINQVAAADTVDQLDAIQATSQDPAVNQAVQIRRDELNAKSVTPAANARAAATVAETGLGPNAVTEPAKPKDHYYVNTNGDHINAFGEIKGSPEDKKRWS